MHRNRACLWPDNRNISRAIHSPENSSGNNVRYSARRAPLVATKVEPMLIMAIPTTAVSTRAATSAHGKQAHPPRRFSKSRMISFRSTSDTRCSEGKITTAIGSRITSGLNAPALRLLSCRSVAFGDTPGNRRQKPPVPTGVHGHRRTPMVPEHMAYTRHKVLLGRRPPT